MMSAAPSTTERGPKTTKADHPAWDELIEALDAHAPQYAELARRARKDGQTSDAFVEGMMAFADDAKLRSGVRAVFSLSNDDELNLSQDEIEFALAELKAGSEPSAVIEQVKRDRALASPWEAALAAYRLAEKRMTAEGGDAANDHFDDAQEALLLTPAPHLEAVLLKVSFIRQFGTSASDEPYDTSVAKRMIARGNGWADRCVAAVFLDLQRLAAGPGSEAERWSAAHGELLRLAATFQEAKERANAAYNRACDATQPPDEISKYPTLGHLEYSSISFAEKMRLAPLVQAHEEARDLAYKLSGHQVFDAVRDEVYDLLEDATTAIMEMQPPTLAALADQIGLALLRATDEDDFTFDTPDGIAEVLSSDRSEVLDLARLYVHAVRLAGLTRPPGWGEAFDVEAWIAEFEAHPGHTLTPRGPEFIEPMAFGPEFPAYEDIKITDPEAIARYDAHVRTLFSPASWKRHVKNGGSRDGRPFCVQQEDAITWAYPDGGDEHDRLMALWRKREEMRSAQPTGRHLWTDLAAWQKRLVREFVEADKVRFPEGRTWDAADWVEAYEGSGGTLHLDDEDEVVMGAPVPTPAHLIRLQRVMKYRADQVAVVLEGRRHLKQGEGA